MSHDNLELILQQALESVRPQLLKSNAVKDTIPFSKEEMTQVFYYLLANHPVEEAYQYIKKFNKFLSQKGLIGKDDNQSFSITKIKRPKARLNCGMTDALKKLSVLDGVFIDSLKYPNLSTKQITGQIVYSALRYGFLLNTKLIKSLFTQLDKPPIYLQEHCWFELKEYIWNPDPLTNLLLLNWHRTHAKSSDTRLLNNPHLDWHQAIKSFFQSGNINWKTQGLNKTTLIKAINARLSLSMPPVLVDCAQGIHDARTLHPQVYLRLITGKAPTIKLDSIKAHYQQQRLPIKIQALSSINGVNDTQLIRSVGQALRSQQKPKAIGAKINALMQQDQSLCTPISKYLCSWISKRINNPNRWGNRYLPSSAYTRLHVLSRRFRSWFGAEELLTLNYEKIIEIYEEIIDSVDTPQHKKSLAKNIRDFQEYMEDEWGLESIDDEPWRHYINLKDGVDSKIVLPKEFERVASYFKNEAITSSSPLDSTLNEARYLVLVLGYKCGLRRKEIMGLRVEDFTEHGKIEILVRSHKYRKLKSTAGNRRIPLSVLLNEQELTTLEHWLTTRRKDCESMSEYVFYTPLTQTPFVEESDLFDPIQFALKIITGDPSTRFHHLRHSYATFAFWRWMHPHYKQYSLKYSGLIQYEFSQIIHERQLILGLEQGNELSQKTAYALALSVGHAGPSMTLSHYVHSHQWMLQAEAIKLSPILSSQTISHLLGISQRQVQKKARYKPTTVNIFSENIVNKLSQFCMTPDIKNWTTPKAKALKVSYHAHVLNNVKSIELWEALQRKVYQHATIDQLVEQYCISKKHIQEAINRAHRIVNHQNTGRGHHNYPHRLKKWGALSEVPLVLKYPRQKRHLELTQNIIARYTSLSTQKKGVVHWGINYFLKRSTVNKSGINFDNKKELGTFIRMINLLDVRIEKSDKKHDRFRLTLVSSSKNDTTDTIRQHQWRYWSKPKNVMGYQRRNQFDKDENRKNGRVIFSIMADKSLEQKKSNEPIHGEKMPTDWGFKLGLYVIAYIYGEKWLDI